MHTLEPLFDSLQCRPRPEDVAETILEVLHGLTPRERALLQQAAAGSLKQGLYRFSSMLQDFQRPLAPTRQADKACELFLDVPPLSDEACSDPERLLALIRDLSRQIRKQSGANDFKADRLNREQRLRDGLDLSKRRYNKLFRFLQRFERKLQTYRLERRKYTATRVAKAGLSILISREDFMASPDAACFVAYYSAARNRRSVFTNGKQARAFDTVADMLLQRHRRAPTAGGWRAIARVMPDAEIVARLSDADKLDLFMQYLAQLQDIAELLRSTWQRSNFDRASMIVRRGDDSSTWNALAGAWNAARQGWLALAEALGMQEVIDRLCPGKVMRLMAGDVAAWHRLSGGSIDPDTLVWAELPAPWDVLDGEPLSRPQVEAVCARHGVDPVAKGWTAPRSHREAAPFTPTPELVHGVEVGHPALAAVLRKAGWFSGKSSTPLDNTD